MLQEPALLEIGGEIDMGVCVWGGGEGGGRGGVKLAGKYNL